MTAGVNKKMGKRRYNILTYKRKSHVGEDNWLGNLRWIAEEMREPLAYRFVTIPLNRLYKNYGNNRLLFELKIEGNLAVDSFTYGADYYGAVGKGMNLRVTFPWEIYGASITWRNVSMGMAIKIKGTENCHIKKLEDKRTWMIVDVPYYVFVQCLGAKAEIGEEGQCLSMYQATAEGSLIISYHIETVKGLETHQLFCKNAENEIAKSEVQWESYLQSCPVAECLGGADTLYSKERLQERQLWYWWCARINISFIEFNKAPIYVAPDKTMWAGTWSNDGPETMAALSMTGDRELARACIVSYVAQSIDSEGNLSWYTHYDGCGCYSDAHDIGGGGRSHGVPNIVNTVDFYLMQTGDNGILEEDIGQGVTLWERLKTYMQHVFEARDINGDGLIEWVNLWETGWDDKICTFFKEADLSIWIETMKTADAQKINAFYEQSCYPMTTMVEQVYFLWALQSMKKMAEMKGERQRSKSYQTQYETMIAVIRDRHWDEARGFYVDWNVRENKLSDAMNADGFYFMYFEKDKSRLERMIRIMEAPEHFGLKCLPMSAKSNDGFCENGYWSGGHWPREMGYMALALKECGYEEKALPLIYQALCGDEGNNVCEVLNPITGKRSTGCTKMAYNVINNVALQIVFEKSRWV